MALSYLTGLRIPENQPKQKNSAINPQPDEVQYRAVVFPRKGVLPTNIHRVAIQSDPKEEARH